VEAVRDLLLGMPNPVLIGNPRKRFMRINRGYPNDVEAANLPTVAGGREAGASARR